MKRFTNRLSPATVIACIALFVSLGGVSYGVATGSIDSREITNNTIRTQDIRNSAVRGGDVRNNSLTGSDVRESSLQPPPSAFNEDASDVASLGGAFVNVASTTITTLRTSRLLATGSAEIVGNGASEGQCQIVIDGNDSIDYEGSTDDVGAPDPQTIAVNFAVTRPAGTHTASLQCRADAGAVAKDDAAISVFALDD